MRNRHDPSALHLERAGATICGSGGSVEEYAAWRESADACSCCWSRNGLDDSTGEPLRDGKENGGSGD